MSKKVKCIDCMNCMRFAIPNKLYPTEDEMLIKILTTGIICGVTMKEKSDENEQYCKYFVEANPFKKADIARSSAEGRIYNIIKRTKEVQGGKDDFQNTRRGRTV